jgi:uncharacterized protein (TIGR02145 family)
MGWHVPIDAEWDTLQNYLIANGYSLDGSITDNMTAKSMAAMADWGASTTAGAVGNNLTANNRSGFSALPGGARGGNGFFLLIGYYGNWWSATALFATTSWSRGMNYDNPDVYRFRYDNSLGFSVRCIKD